MDRMKAKAIRCYFGESFEKFAQRVGVGVATIHAIEKGGGTRYYRLCPCKVSASRIRITG